MDDYLTYLYALGEDLPYDDSTIRLFFDALAYTIAETEFVKPELRTTNEFLKGLHKAITSTSTELGSVYNPEELYELLKSFALAVAARNHQILQSGGEALPQCGLPQPCPYH